VALMAPSGCGGGSKQKDPPAGDQPSDVPAKPPPGWHNVTNGSAGFTLVAPRKWPTSTRRGATLIRSPDRLVAVTVAADRGAKGRHLRAQRYAEEIVRGLPGFGNVLVRRASRIRGTPYESGRLEATAVLRSKRRGERVIVSVLRVPRYVSYAFIAFRNGRVPARVYDPVLERIVLSLRGRPPRQP
jgi:hypothetical protein